MSSPQPTTSDEFNLAKKVTRKELKVLEDVVNSLQERIAWIEGYLRSQDAAYGGTPLDEFDPDYTPPVDAEVVE